MATSKRKSPRKSGRKSPRRKAVGEYCGPRSKCRKGLSCRKHRCRKVKSRSKGKSKSKPKRKLCRQPELSDLDVSTLMILAELRLPRNLKKKLTDQELCSIREVLKSTRKDMEDLYTPMRRPAGFKTPRVGGTPRSIPRSVPRTPFSASRSPFGLGATVEEDDDDIV